MYVHVCTVCTVCCNNVSEIKLQRCGANDHVDWLLEMKKFEVREVFMHVNVTYVHVHNYVHSMDRDNPWIVLRNPCIHALHRHTNPWIDMILDNPCTRYVWTIL